MKRGAVGMVGIVTGITEEETVGMGVVAKFSVF